VKADPFAQLRLLDLQALDSALARLAHRRRTLPEIAEMTRLDGLVAGSRDDVVRAETEASDLARETRKFEDEIAQVRTRKARNDERLSSGAITQSRQLEELQHENVSLVRRQGELEDRELEVMERAEAVQEVLDRLLSEREERLTARQAAEQARDAAWAEIDEELSRTTAERAQVATEIPADLLKLYERIRAAEGGVGAAEIARGRCGGCRLDLMGNEIAEFRAAPSDEVLRHEECTRILVRTAESGL
jgi:predicted  nucleic acid-binding Zn-ribbon protein